MAAILNVGKTKIRDAIKTLITHVGVTDDNTTFDPTHTDLNPAGGSTTNVIKSASISNVDSETFDATIVIDGSQEFTNKTINTIGSLDGATASDVLTRSVRSLGIGVQDGDIFTIGVRIKVEDNSA